MDMTGEHRIPASREAVWHALNDPEVLQVCIPGCEELSKTSDTEFDAVVVQKIGAVRARFKGAVELTNLNAPASYTIQGEGAGGVASFAKGGADVHLHDAGGAAILGYGVQANVGGKLARLGSRLIDATAKKLANKFFDNFEVRMNPEEINVAGEPAESQ